MRFKPLALVAAVIALALPACAQDQCGAARDFMVSALERTGPASGDSEVLDGLELLKHAIQSCGSLGDAWYYRSVFERRLGHKGLAEFALRQARLLGSEALDEQVNPFVLASPPEKPAPRSGAPGDKWALVVGIGQFQDAGIPRLGLTTKDAGDFRDFLINPAFGRFPPDHVHLITDQEATTKRIKAEFNWLARSAGPGDIVVIYFASHGSPGKMDVAGAHYIATYDTVIGGESEEARQDNLYLTALPMEDLASVVRNRIQAGRTAVFLDTCHSGAAAGAAAGGAARGFQIVPGISEASASSATLDRIREGAGRVVMASSQVDESSYESAKLHNGYFTYYLIRGLMQDQGLAPLAKVYGFVRSGVSRDVLEFEKAHQDPVMSASAGADFAIGQAPGAAAAAGR